MQSKSNNEQQDQLPFDLPNEYTSAPRRIQQSVLLERQGRKPIRLRCAVDNGWKNPPSSLSRMAGSNPATPRAEQAIASVLLADCNSRAEPLNQIEQRQPRRRGKTKTERYAEEHWQQCGATLGRLSSLELPRRLDRQPRDQEQQHQNGVGKSARDERDKRRALARGIAIWFVAHPDARSAPHHAQGNQVNAPSAPNQSVAPQQMIQPFSEAISATKIDNGIENRDRARAKMRRSPKQKGARSKVLRPVVETSAEISKSE